MAETKPNLEQRVMREPVIAAEAYDKKKFLKYYDEFGDLIQGKYVNALNNDVNNLGAREGLTGILFGDSNAHLAFEPSYILKTAQVSYEQGVESLARYAQHNKNRFLDILDENALMQLAYSLPMYKNGDEKHDELVRLLNERRNMASIIEEKDASVRDAKMKSFIANRIKSDKGLTKEGKSLFAYLMQSEKISEYMFGRFLHDNERFLSLSLSKKDGDSIKPDKAKYRALVENSLNAAEKAMPEDIGDKNKKKIWENALKQHYVNIANMVYQIEGKDDGKSKSEEEKKLMRERKR